MILGSCVHCGECCLELIRANRHLQDPFPGVGDCYDKEAKRCKIYAERPDICRNFPMNGQQLSSYPNCGYYWTEEVKVATPDVDAIRDVVVALINFMEQETHQIWNQSEGKFMLLEACGLGICDEIKDVTAAEAQEFRQQRLEAWMDSMLIPRHNKVTVYNLKRVLRVLEVTYGKHDASADRR